MDMTFYPECVPDFIDEYKVVIDSFGHDPDDESLIVRLVADCKWTERGAATLVMLARQYGTSILANALALAQVLEIEDGEAGL